MKELLSFLILTTMVFFIIGFISPNKSLFWFKGVRTRLKSSLIYGLLSLSLLLLFSTIYPSDRGTEKKETTENSTQTKNEEEVKEPTNENVSYWLSITDKKKEKFIKKHIKGTWLQVMQLGISNNNTETEIYINRKFKTEYTSKEDFFQIEEFLPSEGFFDYPHFISKSQSDKGKSEYKTSWNVVKNNVVFASGTSDETKEIVLYLSENLCIRKLIEPLTGTEIIGYYTKYNDGVKSQYQNEIEVLNYLDFKEAYTLMQEGISIINSNNDIQGYQSIYNGYKKLALLSKTRESIDLENDEVVKSISTGLKKTYPDFIKSYASNFSNEIEELRKSEVEFVFFEKYNSKMDDLKSLITIGLAFKQDNSLLKSEISKHEKEYKKLLQNYSLYGDMSQESLMKFAASEFIEENAKDPSSIELIDDKTGVIGKTPKGLSYQITYRGKNSFGGLVINSKKLLLKWDVSNKVYYVAGFL